MSDGISTHATDLYGTTSGGTTVTESVTINVDTPNGTDFHLVSEDGAQIQS